MWIYLREILAIALRFASGFRIEYYLRDRHGQSVSVEVEIPRVLSVLRGVIPFL